MKTELFDLLAQAQGTKSIIIMNMSLSLKLKILTINNVDDDVKSSMLTHIYRPNLVCFNSHWIIQDIMLENREIVQELKNKIKVEKGNKTDNKQ